MDEIEMIPKKREYEDVDTAPGTGSATGMRAGKVSKLLRGVVNKTRGKRAHEHMRGSSTAQRVDPVAGICAQKRSQRGPLMSTLA